MASFLQDGLYRLKIVEDDEEDPELHTFMEELAESIFTDFSILVDVPFALRIGELVGDRYHWLMEIWTTDSATGADTLDRSALIYAVRDSQTYFAYNTANRGCCYCGQVDVTVLMPAHQTNLAPGGAEPSLLSSPLLHISLGNYYQQIEKHYPEWHTSYQNSPVRITHFYGTGTADREFWH